MKKNLLVIMVITMIGCFFLASSVYAAREDVTIWDNKNGPSPGWYNRGTSNDFTSEDSETEPGTATGQQWDLEGFWVERIDTDADMIADKWLLFMAGGYDFINGQGGYYAGHLFIDFDTVPEYGTAAENSNQGLSFDGNHNYVVTNSWGYDYAIQFIDLTHGTASDSSGTYWTNINLAATPKIVPAEGFNIATDDSKVTVYYSKNPDFSFSNPWRYDSGGEVLDNELLWSYDAGLPDFNGEGLQGTSHNVATFDITPLVAGRVQSQGEDYFEDWYFHFTYGCGNDNLMGKARFTKDEPGEPQVPIGSSALLLSSGILALIGIRRKYT
jgi:hypothetical protein